MFVETVKTPGLSHLSYVVGDGVAAAVIDPRRDIRIYEEIARDRGVAITHIFETHRNEDLVTGSQNLARRTGARVLRGKPETYTVPYADFAKEGTRIELGEASLSVLETPGHTLDSISLVLRHLETGETPLGVFTGDALFIASRDFTTIGYERAHNPRLDLDRQAFIDFKTGEHHDYPPYFEKMEAINASDGPGLDLLVKPPRPMDLDTFSRAREEGMIVVDLRMPESFAGAHIPGSLALPLAMLVSFAGWVLPYDTPIGFVAASADQAEQGAVQLARIGYGTGRAVRW